VSKHDLHHDRDHDRDHDHDHDRDRDLDPETLSSPIVFASPSGRRQKR
jgi:Cd2+/Zn2+-exporting ATPase